MKKVLLVFIAITGLLISPVSHVSAQGVGINTTGAPADTSAALDVNFTNKGLLSPRMSTSQRNSISNPAAGLLIFNTDCDVFNYNAGSPSSPNWVAVSSSNSEIAGVSIAASPSGPVCSGATVTFTATPATGIVSATYQWQKNGTNVGTNSATYSNNSLSNGDVITCVLSSTDACITGSPATSNSLTEIVTATPITPACTTISGPTSFFYDSAAAAYVYSIPAVVNATTYNWTVPSGTTIVSGTGTSSIKTYFGCNNGSITVTAANTCGSSTFVPTLNVTGSNSLGTPGTISGPTSVAPMSTGNVYSITAMPGARSYNWTVPSGATITAGSGTRSITVTFGCTLGAITVKGANNCNTSATAASLTVNSNFGNPGAITGPTSFTPQSTGNVYSISAVTGASSYNWTVPSDATITNNTGTSITVTFGCIATPITVTAVNICSVNSTTSSLTISSTFGNPGAITGPTTFTPQSTGNVYSISPVTAASSYTWTVPSDATITNNTGTSITVTFGCIATPITVTAVNACGGNSTTSSLTISSTFSVKAVAYDSLSCVSNVITSPGVYIGAIGASAGVTYAWSGPGGFTSSQQDNMVSSPATGTYTVSASNASCTALTSTVTYSGPSCGEYIGFSCTGTQTFKYTGSNQAFIVPAGVTQIHVKTWGAGGGGNFANNNGNGGPGGYSEAIIPVTAGNSLTIVVGGGGSDSCYGDCSGTLSKGGFGGGGNGYESNSGGGYSGVFNGTVSQANALIIAGGGGGGGGGYTNGGSNPPYYKRGGAGGGTTAQGADSSVTSGNGGGPGTQIAGGTGGSTSGGGGAVVSGSALQGGSRTAGNGGGGGGGYWGGGSGNRLGSWVHMAGGGGSGFVVSGATCVTATTGSNATYTTPPNTSDADYVAAGGASAAPAGSFGVGGAGTYAGSTASYSSGCNCNGHATTSGFSGNGLVVIKW